MPDNSYTAEHVLDHGIQAIRLSDAFHGIEVWIAPPVGNRAYKMLVRGQNILYVPAEDPSMLLHDSHTNGIPFLAPWANRMPGGLHANGKHYPVDTSLAPIRLDRNDIPIHGLLTLSPFWEVIGLGADAESAHVTSRLEFWRHPDLMANWPFAHEYEMTYRLAAGVLEVSVTITNRSVDPMPVAVGFHPYFQIPGVPIEDAVAHIPVRRHVETDGRLVATGETTEVHFPERVSLKENRFDDGFTDLAADAMGRTAFWVEGHGKKIEVTFGPRYPVAVIYAPPGQSYICFEPMSTVTNGVNLAAEGKYSGLQTVPSGGQWHESFWIHPTGF